MCYYRLSKLKKMQKMVLTGRYVRCIYVTFKGLDENRYPFPDNYYTLNEIAELIIYHTVQYGLKVTKIEVGTILQNVASLDYLTKNKEVLK